MSSDIHQTNDTVAQQSLKARQLTSDQILPLLRIINAKLDRLLSEVSTRYGNDDEERLGDGLLVE